MGTSRTISCVVLAAGLSLIFVDSADAIKILYHGREAGPTFRDDPFAFAHLETVFGADNVDYILGTDAAADGSSAIGYDVLFISSTMASSATRDKYEDSTVGIVCDEGALANDGSVGNFMLSDNSGNQDGLKDRHKINILNSSHPLAAGLSGEVTVFNNPPALTWSQYGLGVLGGGVDLIADWDSTANPADPTEHAIFAAEVGASLLGNGTAGSPATAAGRRVFFFMSDFGFADLTTDGVALFDAAITWAATDPPAGVPGDYNGNGSVDAADYVLWRDGGPLQNEVVTSGTVTPEDYDEWRARFGNPPGAGSGSAIAAVPEPACFSLGIIALISCMRIRRR